MDTNKFSRLLLLMLSLASVTSCSSDRIPAQNQVRPQQQSPPPGPPGGFAFAPASQRRSVLTVGEQIPGLDGAGWINNAPPRFGEREAKLFVVDVWGQWCSEVTKSIPGLKQLHADYASKGVTFVSLTTEKRETVQAFVNANAIPWSSGYGTTLAAISAIGAFNHDIPMPGYEVKPVLYLTASDGTVIWCDENERMNHADETKVELISTLRKAVESRLAADASSAN